MKMSELQEVTVSKEQLEESLKEFTKVTGLDEFLKSVNMPNINYNDMSNKLWDSIQKTIKS